MPQGTHNLLIIRVHDAWTYESWFIFTKMNVGFVKLSYVWMRHELVYCPLLTSYTFHCLSILLNENTTWILVTFKGFSVFCIATRSYHPLLPPASMISVFNESAMIHHFLVMSHGFIFVMIRWVIWMIYPSLFFFWWKTDLLAHHHMVSRKTKSDFFTNILTNQILFWRI